MSNTNLKLEPLTIIEDTGTGDSLSSIADSIDISIASTENVVTKVHDLGEYIETIDENVNQLTDNVLSQQAVITTKLNSIKSDLIEVKAQVEELSKVNKENHESYVLENETNYELVDNKLEELLEGVKGLQNPELNQSLIRNHKEIIELLNKALEATKNIKEVNLPKDRQDEIIETQLNIRDELHKANELIIQTVKNIKPTEVNLPEDKQDLILEAVKTIHIPETKLPEDKQVEILEAVESLKAHIVKEAKEPEVPILEGYSGGIMAALGAICLVVGLLFGTFKSKIFLLFTSIFSKIKGKIKK